ncbi:sigma-54-dependent Fis family transcriptional regulator [Candidatus Poribacteria bacterium]|nr:sigma-54-dependent Fis family transcriptional regulator [Candidatus Poribacteria bacterium]
MSSSEIKTILVVDDDENARESITYALNEEGYNTIFASNEERALDYLNEKQVDLVITALKVPTIDGMKILGITKEKFPKVDVIMVANSNSVEIAVEAIKAGAHDLQTKPIDINKLKMSIEASLSKQIILAKDLESPHPLDSNFGLTGFVGNSDKIQRIYRILNQVAATNTDVLIYGETGTGKNLAARAIHYNSPRRDRPFVELSCAALPEDIIESELFGHERGAFTNAIRTKKGRFELANGGTLFLNEVSDISPYTQVKLLRILEDREFERVGGVETIKVDVRLIAATNESLEEAIKEGRFREDLYYRLKTVTIDLPPLRQRKEDILLLVDHFIREANRFNGKNIKGITDQAMQFLIKYHWPGNVRELKNCVEGMVVMARSSTLGVNDLPKHIRRSGDDGWRVDIHVGMSVKDAERKLIVETLKYTNNNKAQAAKILNMGLRTLFRKVKEYEID